MLIHYNFWLLLLNMFFFLLIYDFYIGNLPPINTWIKEYTCGTLKVRWFNAKNGSYKRT